MDVTLDFEHAVAYSVATLDAEMDDSSLLLSLRLDLNLGDYLDM